MLGEVQIELNALPLRDIRPQFAPLRVEGRVVAGHLHLIVQRSELPNEGMLAYHGPPLHSIPYRADAGGMRLAPHDCHLCHVHLRTSSTHAFTVCCLKQHLHSIVAAASADAFTFASLHVHARVVTLMPCVCLSANTGV